MVDISELFMSFNLWVLSFKNLITFFVVSDNVFLGAIYILIFNIFISMLLFNKYLKILFFVPGTIVHEFWHFLFSLIFNGKPSSFSIIPKFEQNRIVLGSVSNRNITWYNAFLIGFAPLMSFVIVFYIYKDYLSYSQPLLFVSLSFFMSIILRNAIPSTTDVKLAFKYSLPVLVLLAIGYLLINYDKISILNDFISKIK